MVWHIGLFHSKLQTPKRLVLFGGSTYIHVCLNVEQSNLDIKHVVTTDLNQPMCQFY